jgi:hypothetical protein
MSSRNASIQPWLPKGFAHLWTKKRIVDPALGFMSIKIGRRPGPPHPVGKQFSCMGSKALTSAAYGRTWDRAPGCRWVGKDSQSGSRLRQLQCIGHLRLGDRLEVPCGSLEAPRRMPEWQRRLQLLAVPDSAVSCRPNGCYRRLLLRRFPRLASALEPALLTSSAASPICQCDGLAITSISFQ